MAEFGALGAGQAPGTRYPVPPQPGLMAEMTIVFKKTIPFIS